MAPGVLIELLFLCEKNSETSVRFDLTPTVHLCDIGFHTFFDESLPHPSTRARTSSVHPNSFCFLSILFVKSNIFHCLDRALWRDKQQTLLCISLMIAFLPTKQRNHYNEIIWCCTYSWQILSQFSLDSFGNTLKYVWW